MPYPPGVPSGRAIPAGTARPSSSSSPDTPPQHTLTQAAHTSSRTPGYMGGRRTEKVGKEPGVPYMAEWEGGGKGRRGVYSKAVKM